MNKTLLALLLAGLLLLSATACSPHSTGDETGSGTESETTDKGNDPLNPDNQDGSESEDESNEETESESEQKDISEVDPTVSASSISEIYVFATQATIRKTTVVDATNKNYAATAYLGDSFKVTGETANWYQIDVGDLDIEGDVTTAYIAKTVAADKAVIDAFTPCDPETVTITGAASVNLRSYPSTASNYSKQAIATKGTVVTRIAIGDGWSLIRYQAEDDTEPKNYYISTSLLDVEEESATESNTEADTESGTESSTEADTSASA